jgi:hypothetical protein
MSADEVADKLIAGWIKEPPPHVVDAAVMLRQQAATLAGYEDRLKEIQDFYKARGKTLQAHVINNARQKLRRVGK